MPALDKKAAKAAAERAEGEAAVRAKIGEMPAPLDAVALRLHEIIMAQAPELTPLVRYGMPWYMRDGKSWCFFRAAADFGFITFGFDDPADPKPEDAAADRLVVSAYRLTALDAATEAKLAAAIRRAAS
jgi:hypothetical protein